MWRFLTVMAAAALTFAAAGAAEAGIFGKAAAVISGEVIALILSAAIVLAAGAAGAVFLRVARTFRETGEFLTILGEALDDRRISREELSSIVKEGKDIFAVWK